MHFPAPHSLEAAYWEKRRRVWRRIPELAGMPDERADAVYRRATARERRQLRPWGAVLAALAAHFGVGMLVSFVWQTIARSAIAIGLGVVATQLLALFTAVATFNVVMIPVRRRAVRTTLGTHCPRCDYDLRAGHDPAGPRVARCPECGDPAPPDGRYYPVQPSEVSMSARADGRWAEQAPEFP